MADETIRQLEKDNKQFGWFKSTKLLLQKNVVVILLALLNGGISVAGTLYTKQQINNISTNIKNEININPSQGNPKPSQSPQEPKSSEPGSVQGDKTDIEFNPKDWFIEKYYPDKDGFLCRDNAKTSFPIWSIWSHKKYPVTFGKLSIRLFVKSEENSINPKTIAISYGDYQENTKSISTVYSLSVFDTKDTDIRLYNKNNDSNGNQGYLSNDPDFNQEIVISIYPQYINNSKKTISLSPSLDYIPSVTPWAPQNGFETDLFLPDPDGVQKQIGIGAKQGTCFKLISVEIQ